MTTTIWESTPCDELLRRSGSPSTASRAMTSDYDRLLSGHSRLSQNVAAVSTSHLATEFDHGAVYVCPSMSPGDIERVRASVKSPETTVTANMKSALPSFELTSDPITLPTLSFIRSGCTPSQHVLHSQDTCMPQPPPPTQTRTSSPPESPNSSHKPAQPYPPSTASPQH